MAVPQLIIVESWNQTVFFLGVAIAGQLDLQLTLVSLSLSLSLAPSPLATEPPRDWWGGSGRPSSQVVPVRLVVY